MKNKLLIFLSLFLSVLCSSVSVHANTIILRGMHVKKEAHESFVTFDLSASTHYRAFMLHNPNRFVIDLRNVKNYQRLHSNNFNGMPIKDFKYATHSKDVFRIVFGLRNAIAPKVRVLPAGENHQARLQVGFQNRTRSFAAVTEFPVEKKRLIKKESQELKEPKEHTVLSDVDFEKNSTRHRDIIIVIDPGHGGKDPGATGQRGTHEKDIVLSISKIVQRQINQNPGFHALLTRTSDYYLTLRQRLAIARKDKADMFIAIHADTWRNKQARGVSVFALSQRGATSEAARWFAKRENASELMGGVDLQDKSHLLKSVLINLSQAATIRSSLEIGENVIQSVKPISRLHHPRVEQAAFVVLKSPDIPSLLVETGFLSNSREEQKLRSGAYQSQLGAAIMRGINRYFTYYPPRDTWLSYWRNHPNLAHRKHTDYQS